MGEGVHQAAASPSSVGRSGSTGARSSTCHGRVRHGGVHGHGQRDQAAGAEPGPQPDPHRRQMPIHQQRPPGLELPQRLRRQQPPIGRRLGQRRPAVPAGRLRGLGDGLVADQLGGQLEGGRVGLAGQQQLGPMAVQDGGGAVAVAVLELGLVVPDGQQLDALAAAGGGQLGELLDGGAVAGLVQAHEQPGVEHAVGLGGGQLLGLVDHHQTSSSNRGRSRSCSVAGAYRYRVLLAPVSSSSRSRSQPSAEAAMTGSP